MQVPWGKKAFAGYLGDADWETHDTCALLAAGKRWATTPLVDQGLADKFLETQLRPELLEAANVPVRRHAGYDHSYYFIATVVADHLRHHARHLKQR
jgi:S-formylglutathione hydrolase